MVGPPGAGKTTFVDEHRQPADMVIDYDRIADAVGGGHAPAMVARNALLKALQNGRLPVAVVWLISADPKAETSFPSHLVHLVDPGMETLVSRGLDPKRLELARRWYAARAASSVSAGDSPSRDW